MGANAPTGPEVLVLRDVEDLSYQEICNITGLAEGTVKSRLHRARMSLKDYLAKRRGKSPDDLHGPLDATVLAAARNRILGRLQSLSGDIERAQVPLVALRDQMTVLRREIDALAATDPGGTRLAARRESLVVLEEKWDRETGRVRRYLGARDQLHADGVRICDFSGARTFQSDATRN